MRANRRTRGAHAVAVTLLMLAFAAVVLALSREDVLMIALGLLLAATSMELFGHR
jgi:hypothetical protein